jgi:hypothetical protein
MRNAKFEIQTAHFEFRISHFFVVGQTKKADRQWVVADPRCGQFAFFV